jgi:hypothetical protein
MFIYIHSYLFPYLLDFRYISVYVYLHISIYIHIGFVAACLVPFMFIYLYTHMFSHIYRQDSFYFAQIHLSVYVIKTLGFVAACLVPLIAKQSIAAVDAREGTYNPYTFNPIITLIPFFCILLAIISHSSNYFIVNFNF